jgi:hypothetical protein
VGDCVQVAVNVTLLPTYGDWLLAVTVHTGGAVGGCCQLICTRAAGPTPDALLAYT